MLLRRFLRRIVRDRAGLLDFCRGERRNRDGKRRQPTRPLARLALEALEGRDLPNLLAGPIPLDLGLLTRGAGPSTSPPQAAPVRPAQAEPARAPAVNQAPAAKASVGAAPPTAAPTARGAEQDAPSFNADLVRPPVTSLVLPLEVDTRPLHRPAVTGAVPEPVHATSGGDPSPAASHAPSNATGATEPPGPSRPASSGNAESLYLASPATSSTGRPGPTPLMQGPVVKGAPAKVPPPKGNPPGRTPPGRSGPSGPGAVAFGPLAVTPGLMGLAQASLPPDIASGALTRISYTQIGNNANPFHYDSIPLAILLADGRKFNLGNPTGGARKTNLDLKLDNLGAFAAGVAGPDFSVTGKVTIDGTTFDGTLVTGEVRAFGSRVSPGNAEFEVRIVITGGTLTNPANGYLKVGGELGLLIHQPGLPISAFPQTFSYTGTLGTSDARKMSQLLTNSESIVNDCGCTTSDLPMPSGNGSQQDGAGWVYLHDGESYQQITDLVIPGRGLDYRFTRTYRSGVQSSGALGHNWVSNYERQLRVANAQSLTELRLSFPMVQLGDVIRLDGYNRADIYKLNPDGSYTSPDGFFTRLTRNPDGSYSERDENGTVTSYAPTDRTGQSPMMSMADRNGNTLTFQYNPQGQLATVVDTMGRPITYTYDPVGQLTEIRDYAGRPTRFTYDSAGELVGVTTPPVTGTPNGNDFPMGKTERYTYSDGLPNERLNHQLQTVTSPNEVANGGPPRLTYTYDTNPSSPNAGRVTSLNAGGTNASGVPSGGTIQYTYEALATPPPGDVSTPVSRTTVTDRNGDVTRYEYNQRGNVLKVTELNNRGVRPGDPASYTTTYQYDRDYHLLQETLPQGNTVRYVYDSSNPSRFSQGNLLEVTATPDAVRGGDQAAITTRFTYEPIYNQLRTVVEARGNDPTYVPQNGGPNSPGRYTTTYTYDYQESTNFAALGGPMGLTPAQAAALLAGAGVPMGLGDVNGDARTDQTHGNVIFSAAPTVHLLPGSNQATVEGSTLQPIVTRYTYNDLGQVTSSIDPESNVNQYQYYSERDPNGDGTIDNPSGNPTTGGYLFETRQDTTSAPGRDSNTNPAPADIHNRFQYDAVGNVTRAIDGRGIATDYVYNQLDQVVQVTQAAAHGLYGPDPGEPEPLTDFRYVSRYFYDFNDDLVLSQVEDRGNTSNVDGNLSPADLPSGVPGASNADPVGGPAFVDTAYRYDILDNPVTLIQEVTNGASPETLRTQYRYDPNENPVLTIEPAGNASSAVYDERDLVFRTTAGATSPPPLAQLASGDPTSYDVRGGLASTTSFRYDLNGNLSEVVDADDTDSSAANNDPALGGGDRTRFLYDGFDRPTSVVDSVGNQTVSQYDPAGKVVRTSSFGQTGGPSPTSDGPITLPAPVSSGGVIQSGNLVNGNLLRATEFSYDELGRAYQADAVLFVSTIPTVRAADVADGATDLGKGNLTPGDNQAIPGVSGVTILGRVTGRTEYDRNSRPTFTVQDDGDTSRAFYDGVGRVIKTLDPQGNTVEAAYDDNSNVIESRMTDVSQVAGVPNEVFLTTMFYDSLDRVQRSVSNIGQTTEYRYDSRDNLVATADAQGPVTGATITRRAFSGGALTVNTINGFGNVTRYFYDGLGRQVRQEATLTASGQGDGAHVGASLYGVKDDPSAPESFAPTPDATQGGGDGIIRTGFTYDQNSLSSALLDDQGNVTVYLYDNLDRQVAETKGLTTSSTLTNASILGPRRIATPTAATINNPAAIPTSQIDAQLADAHSRLVAVAGLFPSLADRVDDHPPTTVTAGYDPDGNVLIHSDENNSYTYAKYDAIDRPIAARIFRAGQSDSFAGDPVFAPAPASLPTNHTSDDGQAFQPVVGTNKTDYQYDGLSRLVRASDNNDPTVSADDSTVTMAYDSLGRVIEETQQIGALPAKAIDSSWRAENLRKSLTYPDGRVVAYSYDALDRLKTVGDQGAALPIAVYDYIGVGRVLQRVSPQNGTRMTFLNDAGTADVGYDGAQRPVQMRYLRSDNSLVVGFTHTYDRMNDKLTEGKLHDPAHSESYQYDSAYRLTHFSQGSLQHDWTLDGVGNWKQFDAETRQHTSFNEVSRRTDGGTTTSLRYDDSGNLIDDGTLRYTWDSQDRLRTVTRASDGAVIATFSYDALGRRVRMVVSNSGALDGTTDFYSDGNSEIEERDATDAVVRQYVYGDSIDEPLVMDRVTPAGVERLFYHQNALGSVYALTDVTGKIVEAYQYDAYGRQTVISPGPSGMVVFGAGDVVTLGGASLLGNPFLFTGRRLDAATGLDYYRQRYYSADLGRFISRWGDSASDPNLYQYQFSSPNNLPDPMGDPLPLIVVGVIVAGVGVAAIAGGIRGYRTGQDPGFWESLIPGWGSGRSAGAAFSRGEWGWGIFHTAMAVSDLFMAGAIAKTLLKVGGKTAAKLGLKELFHFTNAGPQLFKSGFFRAGAEGVVWATKLSKLPTFWLSRWFRTGLPTARRFRITMRGGILEWFKPHPITGYWSLWKRLGGQYVSARRGYNIVFRNGILQWERQALKPFLWGYTKYYTRLTLEWTLPSVFKQTIWMLQHPEQVAQWWYDIPTIPSSGGGGSGTGVPGPVCYPSTGSGSPGSPSLPPGFGPDPTEATYPMGSTPSMSSASMGSGQ